MAQIKLSNYGRYKVRDCHKGHSSTISAILTRDGTKVDPGILQKIGILEIIKCKSIPTGLDKSFWMKMKQY